MDEFFASKAVTNCSYVCVGPLTRDEGADASIQGIGDGTGYYIYVAETSNKRGPVEILGRIADGEAARRLCDLLGLQSCVAV
jgi:hypothetical protein